MELTKYNHACFIITKGSERLLVDPGGWTELPDDLSNITALVITHAHPDHFDKQKVAKVLKENPEVQIFSTAEVASQITKPHVLIPETSHDYAAGSFNLRFYGGLHAVIHKSIPVIGSLGVCVDGEVFYPGDSFTHGPEKGVKVLLAPAAAPWMKIGEGIDFILHHKAGVIIPTHDAFLAESGQQMHDSMLSDYAEKAGGTYRRLQAGETITV